MVLALSLLGLCVADGWRDGRASFYGKDAYGKQFDRSSVCYNTVQSLLIRVVDSCPCYYPGNYYSNKRWCCGDVDHMDMSVWAFEKLADKKWGVIGIQRWNPQQGPIMVQGWQFGDPTGSSSERRASSAAADWSASATATAMGSVTAGSATASSAGGAAQQAGAVLAQALGLGVQGARAQAHAGQSAAGGGQGTIYLNGLQNGWRDASYSARVAWYVGTFGADGSGSVCADLRPGGALAVTHAPGAFAGAESLEWRVRTSEGRPDVTVNVSAGKRYCSPLSLAALPVLERRAGWARYSVHLGDFGGSYPPAAVQGCGGGGAGQLTTVEFRSAVGAGRQVVCLDMVRLLPGASSS
ncbi:hypothetical protein C2E20_1964 [Micractinium conductrix]|uniref:Expansin-like EG45 domain-containing protein n=1 Tax=Micractinium conductrix TaxID=554055 RepID=A0A2P6VM92_9CHLO|nr:hypothetical protein C2E20_1964 [Micractinium conductrix]|eukprot:PSC75221.1 hypothetical protein C2E20_1964 [Micractinium conductrix]